MMNVIPLYRPPRWPRVVVALVVLAALAFAASAVFAGDDAPADPIVVAPQAR